MANTKKEKHIHLLKRHQYRNKEEIYFCIKDCKFRVNVKLSIGKIVECNVCGQPFSMNERSSRMARPNCDECSKNSVKAQKRRKDKEIATGKPEVSLEDLGINLPELKGIVAPKDSILDLKSKMAGIRGVNINPSPAENSVKIIHSENDNKITESEALDKGDELL